MKLKAVLSEKLSHYGDPRYIVIDEETGEILDDAQGYGYKSAKRAYAGAGYKFRDKSKDTERVKKEQTIRDWISKHKDFMCDMDQIALEIAKRSWGPDTVFDAKMVKEMLEQAGYENLPFTASELYRYWSKGPTYTKKKRHQRGDRHVEKEKTSEETTATQQCGSVSFNSRNERR